MVLRDKIRVPKMSRIDTIAIYLTRITYVDDELEAIGETIDDHDLMRTTLNGFTKSWDVFFLDLLHERIFPNGSACGMISFKRIYRGIHYMESSREEMKKITFLLH